MVIQFLHLIQDTGPHPGVTKLLCQLKRLIAKLHTPEYQNFGKKKKNKNAEWRPVVLLVYLYYTVQ